MSSANAVCREQLKKHNPQTPLVIAKRPLLRHKHLTINTACLCLWLEIRSNEHVLMKTTLLHLHCITDIHNLQLHQLSLHTEHNPSQHFISQSNTSSPSKLSNVQLTIKIQKLTTTINTNIICTHYHQPSPSLSRGGTLLRGDPLSPGPGAVAMAG